MYGYASSSRNARNAGRSCSLDLESGEHAAEVGAVIAVVEQADVPAPTELLEKLRERARTFGKLESAQPLVPHLGRMAADHVTHVQLGELVVGEIDGLVPSRRELRRQRRTVLARLRREADEDVRLLSSAQPVVELGHRAPADDRTELLERRPRFSGSVIAISVSRDSPTSARSATNRSRSKLMLAPLSSATSD